ncbi:MAG: glycosyltransferase family 9 protein [Planctomycetota bacterium]|nr:glycosyltransferase family 9 protein [Planctomycetota bacterium]
MPVLCALREALPQAFLAWVVEGVSTQLLRAHPALDELITVPRKWLKSPRTVLGLRKKLHSLKFDVAIDMQGLTKSAVAARLSGAKVRIGYGGVDGRELSPWLNNKLVEPTGTHVIDRNLELLKPLGISNPAVQYRLEDTPEDLATAERMLAELRLTERFAVINPGAGWPSKVWPAARYGEVARFLGQQHGVKSLVVWAGDQERAWAEQIVAGSGGHGVLAPKTSLRELAALSRKAIMFVGSDTGPLHLAVAVGTPSVGMFGPMPAERNGPYGPLHVPVQRVCLTGSSREKRSAGPESMEAISVADCCAACETILNRRGLRKTA